MKDNVVSAPATLQIESHEWYHQRHHATVGFRNIWKETTPPVSFFKMLRWVIGHAWQSKKNVPPAVHPIDPAKLERPSEGVRMTWLGHSSFLIQTPLLTIAVDPVFSRRASPVSFIGPKRLTEVPISLDELPQIDLVLLSHNHYDHCDKKTLKTLFSRFDPVVLIPLGMRSLMEEWKARRIAELDWWQYVDVGGLRFHATPAKHFSGRGLRDRNHTLWTSWYLEGIEEPMEGMRLYFGGDSAYADHFVEIRERLGAPDLAMIPIGAYLPRWFMEPVHMDPAQAMQSFLDIGAQQCLPIHWGTFDLADEPIGEPIALTKRHWNERQIEGILHELPVGGILSL